MRNMTTQELARSLILEFGFNADDTLVDRVAKDIENALQLPQRTLALKCAQGVVNSSRRRDSGCLTVSIHELRNALDQIKTT